MPMFQDLGELDHVFELLDDHSNSPVEEKLNWISGSKSEFNRRLTALMTAIYRRELAAGMKRGASHQSSILSDLRYCLGECSKPSKLKAYLPELKELLLKSYVINLDHRVYNLKKYSSSKDKFIERFKSFDNKRPEKRRRESDALSKLLLKVLGELGKEASAIDVWKYLEKLANAEHGLIEEVRKDGDPKEWYLYWGKNKLTTFRTLSNRLSKLRKEI